MIKTRNETALGSVLTVQKRLKTTSHKPTASITLPEELV